MNIRILRRIVEIFFQKWPIYVVLLAGFIGLGIFSVVRAAPSYTSSGTIFVDNQSLVSAQSGIPNGSYFSFLSPAQFTSQELDGLLQTDVFMASVLDRAGVELPSDPALRASEVAALRDGVSSWASSQNLVRVYVSSADADLSYRLVDAIIAEFVQYQIGLDVAESGASEVFFSELAAVYEANLEAVREELDGALRGVVDIEELPADRQLEIDRLREAEALADERYQAAVGNIETSRLAGLQTETDIRQSYSTFDPPQRPSEPDANFFDGIMLLVLFTTAGLFAALLWPSIAGFTSRNVLFAEEIENQPILGAIPRISKQLVQLKGAPEPAEKSPSIFIDDQSLDIVDQATRTITFKSRPRPSDSGAEDEAQSSSTPDEPITGPTQQPADDNASSDELDNVPTPVTESVPLDEPAPSAEPLPLDAPAPTTEPVALPAPPLLRSVPAEVETDESPAEQNEVASPEPGTDGEFVDEDEEEEVPVSNWDPVRTVQFNLLPPPPDTDGGAADASSMKTRSKHA